MNGWDFQNQIPFQNILREWKEYNIIKKAFNDIFLILLVRCTSRLSHRMLGIHWIIDKVALRIAGVIKLFLGVNPGRYTNCNDWQCLKVTLSLRWQVWWKVWFNNTQASYSEVPSSYLVTSWPDWIYGRLA